MQVSGYGKKFGLKYKPKRDIPKFVKEYHTFSPSKIREIVLKKRNKNVTAESITMWFKRHLDVLTELKSEVIAEELPKLEVGESIFENGTFEELPSVKTWIKEMKRRKIVAWQQNVDALKRCCKGMFKRWHIDLVTEGKMNFKHPDRLTLKDALELLDFLDEHDVDTASIRIPLRGFLESKGITVGKKISGAKGKSFGKFADLYVEKYILEQILEWVKGLNFEAYAIDLFMYKTGTRIISTLNALIENIRVEGRYREITVYDKARRTRHPEGKPWKKYIPQDLWEVLNQIIGERTEGKIFSLTDRKMVKVNKATFNKFIPKLSKKISKPNHFWRHMFFQHMLRTTDWNYGVCASLGGSTVMSLEESYGKPPRAIVREWGLKYIPSI